MFTTSKRRTLIVLALGMSASMGLAACGGDAPDGTEGARLTTEALHPEIPLRPPPAPALPMPAKSLLTEATDNQVQRVQGAPLPPPALPDHFVRVAQDPSTAMHAAPALPAVLSRVRVDPAVSSSP
jgi:hypothetical protein